MKVTDLISKSFSSALVAPLRLPHEWDAGIETTPLASTSLVDAVT